MQLTYFQEEKAIFSWSKMTEDYTLLSHCHDWKSYHLSAEHVSLWLMLSVLLSHVTAWQQRRVGQQEEQSVKSKMWKEWCLHGLVYSLMKWKEAGYYWTQYWSDNNVGINIINIWSGLPTSSLQPTVLSANMKTLCRLGQQPTKIYKMSFLFCYFIIQANYFFLNKNFSRAKGFVFQISH